MINTVPINNKNIAILFILYIYKKQKNNIILTEDTNYTFNLQYH
jgi:hypothetical protein